MLENCFFNLGNVAMKQAIGIPLGIDLAPFWGNLFLYSFFISVCIPNFSLNWKFYFFEQICPTRYFPLKTEKSEHHWWLQHIWISPGNRFQLKLAVLTFWTKFTQKGCFQSKSEKMNTTIELCIFKSVCIPNFSLNWQFWFSGPNLPKKEYISSKLEKRE